MVLGLKMDGARTMEKQLGVICGLEILCSELKFLEDTILLFLNAMNFVQELLLRGVIYSVDFSFVYNVINCSEMKGFLNFYA